MRVLSVKHNSIHTLIKEEVSQYINGNVVKLYRGTKPHYYEGVRKYMYATDSIKYAKEYCNKNIEVLKVNLGNVLDATSLEERAISYEELKEFLLEHGVDISNNTLIQSASPLIKSIQSRPYKTQFWGWIQITKSTNSYWSYELVDLISEKYDTIKWIERQWDNSYNSYMLLNPSNVEIIDTLDCRINIEEDNFVRSTNTDNPQIDTTRTYHQTQSVKPEGLWYEIDDDWKRWCQYEMPEWIKKYDIILDIDLTDVLIIESGEQLEELVNNYSSDPYENSSYFSKQINWGKLAEDYKGIEIHVDNMWDYRYKLMFFNAWDVNSGCIWDLSAIKGQKATECDKEEYKSPYDIEETIKEEVSQYINEISFTNSYTYKRKSSLSSQNKYYSFITEKGTEYHVEFNKEYYIFNDKNKLDYIQSEIEEECNASMIDFTIENHGNYHNGYDYSNEYDAIKVMSTIIKIIQDYIKEDDRIKYIIYEPLKSEKDMETEKISGRERLYLYAAKQYGYNPIKVPHENAYLIKVK